MLLNSEETDGAIFKQFQWACAWEGSTQGRIIDILEYYIIMEWRDVNNWVSHSIKYRKLR